MNIGRGNNFTIWTRLSTDFSSDSLSIRHDTNESNISRANNGSFNSRKYNFNTPATEFISRFVTLINGSSPFSNDSLNWLISICAPGTRKMPYRRKVKLIKTDLFFVILLDYVNQVDWLHWHKMKLSVVSVVPWLGCNQVVCHRINVADRESVLDRFVSIWSDDELNFILRKQTLNSFDFFDFIRAYFLSSRLLDEAAPNAFCIISCRACNREIKLLLNVYCLNFYR